LPANDHYESLYDRLANAKSDNRHFAKDREKARNANKFIGRGSLASSTHRYMLAAGDLANCGQYIQSDVVFVSVEGNRRGRLPLDVAEVSNAIRANATVVADGKADRERPYNVGERELCALLEHSGYIEQSGGVWRPRSEDSRKDRIELEAQIDPPKLGFNRLR